MARVLILRPAEDGAETAAALAELGHEPILLPLHAITRLAVPPPEGDVGGFLVTSSNAVAPLAKAFPDDGRPVLCVGTRTGEAARKAGLGSVIVGYGDASSLLYPAKAVFEAGGLPFLYVAGRVRSAEFEAGLDRLGVGFLVWVVYDTVALDPSAEAVSAAIGCRPVEAVLLLSAGQAESYLRLAAAMPDLLGAGPTLLCLSPRIAAILPDELKAAAVISEVPRLDALFDRLR